MVGAGQVLVARETEAGWLCPGDCVPERERVATLRTADQPLHNTWRDGVPTRPDLVLVKQFLSASEALFRYQRWHWDLEPLFTRAVLARLGIRFYRLFQQVARSGWLMSSRRRTPQRQSCRCRNSRLHKCLRRSERHAHEPAQVKCAESAPPVFSSVYRLCPCMASRSWRQISLNSLNGSSVPSMPFARISSGDRLGSA